MNKLNKDQIIKTLNLKPLPEEGGFFRLVHRTHYSSAIYYLVTPDDFSSLHRLKSDEIFHFYLGDPAEMIQINNKGELFTATIGNDLLNNEEPQVLVPANVWQGTRLKTGGTWALLGTTMAPRYEDKDFELGDRNELINLFPQHTEIIKLYTR